MAEDSWPRAVTSWNDTVVKFARLLLGEKVDFRKYSDRLPRRSQRSFLLFAKGAWARGKPFHGIADLIEPQLKEIGSGVIVTTLTIRLNHSKCFQARELSIIGVRN